MESEGVRDTACELVVEKGAAIDLVSEISKACQRLSVQYFQILAPGAIERAWDGTSESVSAQEESMERGHAAQACRNGATNIVLEEAAEHQLEHASQGMSPRRPEGRGGRPTGRRGATAV